MKSMADRIIAFNAGLRFDDPLPSGIRVMNPFQENAGAFEASSLFYRKYYSDNRPRYCILGINPGRFGAGLTGVPFTDPKRLVERCGITRYAGPAAHEPSSVFVYDVIEAYGGEAAFYGDFYINSICPLGFVAEGKNGKEVNYNYYDSKELAAAARAFMVASLRAQIALGLRREVCFCLGTGKNEKHIREINREHNFFEWIIPLEHPRYVIQYKSKSKQQYIDKYMDKLRTVKAP